MRINKIKVNNFSKFYSENSFEINNKTYFTGKNGSGKTTMIRILKLTLYGNLIFQNEKDKSNFFRNLDIMDYKNYIYSELNRRAKKEGNYTSSVTIDINLKIKGNIKRFIIKRKWNLKYNFDENFTVYELNKKGNKKLLEPLKALKIQKYIRIAFPPNYFDFFLLDGEVRDPLLEDNFNTIFREVTLSLFNLDLIDKLIEDINDIKTLEEQLKLFQTMDMLQYRFNELLNQIKKKKEKLNNIEIEEKKEKIKAKIKELNKEKNKVNRKIKKEYKSNKFPKLKNNIQKSLNGYFQKRFDKYINLLEEKLNSIIPEFVEQIKNTNIDFKNFFLEFYSYQDFKFPIENFSTAESQLLKYTLLIALLDISKKDFPLIADNMQTRLDKRNRRKIINKLKELDKQIIMFDLDNNLSINSNNQYKLTSKIKNKIS